MSTTDDRLRVEIAAHYPDADVEWLLADYRDSCRHAEVGDEPTFHRWLDDQPVTYWDAHGVRRDHRGAVMIAVHERSIADVLGRRTPAGPTRDRSVAEIIGWEYTDDGYVILPNGERHEGHVRVTPDDMLSWLVATGHVWSAQKFGTGVMVTIAYVETGVEWIPPAFEAPTLHAALEKAVRAVAEATNG